MTDIKDKATQRHVENLVSKLRRRQLTGSQETALETVLVLRQVVSSAKFSSIDQLISMIKSVGRRLVEAQPKEQSVGNIVRKVLKLIREEYSAAANVPDHVSTPPVKHSPLPGGHSTPQTPTRPSPLPTGSTSSTLPSATLASFLLLGQQSRVPTLTPSSSRPPSPPGPSKKPSVPKDFSLTSAEDLKKAISVKPALIQAIQEVIDELETVYENVAKNAKDHIHSDEIILTVGMSRTVEAFLKSAAHYRKFTAIVAETAPSFSGHEMARSLASAGISTVLVPDSAIYTVMSRVNKVFLGAHAVLANGGLFAITGSLLAATAARAHSTPVVVCAGQVKLTPLWNLYHDFGALDFAQPEMVLGFEEGNLVDKVDVLNPYYDYVKPDLVDVLITNYGDYPPSYVYRLIKDTYDDEDYEL